MSSPSDSPFRQDGMPIYLDYQATTPCDPRVVEAMIPHFTAQFGNPHSKGHAYGWRAEEAVEIAREQVANIIGARAKEVIFTSGATESNNLAIKGMAAAYQGHKKHIICLETEHKCARESCLSLEKQGYEVTLLPVQKATGLVDLDQLADAMRDDTLLVSIMAVHNEIGTIQPMAEIGALCRSRGVFFHCDAAQAFGKIPLDVEAMQVDTLSISGHKIYGPQGVGALYIRRRPKVRIEPLFSGGGQERGLRSGTVPVALVAGLGKAGEIAASKMELHHQTLQGYYEQFLARTVDVEPAITLNGHRTQRWPGNLNLSFAGIRGESILLALKQLAISSGSACSSGSIEPSYVLKAIGVPQNVAHTSIRFGFGRFTTAEEVDFAAASVVEALRKLSQ